MVSLCCILSWVRSCGIGLMSWSDIGLFGYWSFYVLDKVYIVDGWSVVYCFFCSSYGIGKLVGYLF